MIFLHQLRRGSGNEGSADSLGPVFIEPTKGSWRLGKRYLLASSEQLVVIQLPPLPHQWPALNKNTGAIVERNVAGNYAGHSVRSSVYCLLVAIPEGLYDVCLGTLCILER